MGKRAQKSAPAAPRMPADWPQAYKVSIAWAGYGQVTNEFCTSLVLAVKTLECPLRLDCENSCYVHRNRNVLLERALASDSTHLMFVDTDIAFPRDGIQQLIARQKPIIGGAYNLKRDPVDGVTTTTVKALPEDYEGTHGNWIMDKSAPFECRALPTGFMLIDLRVLRAIPDEAKPEFGGDRVGDPNAGPRNWFDFGNYAGFVGEDVYFCDFVRNLGIPVWCDPTIKLGHVGPKVF